MEHEESDLDRAQRLIAEDRRRREARCREEVMAVLEAYGCRLVMRPVPLAEDALRFEPAVVAN